MKNLRIYCFFPNFPISVRYIVNVRRMLRYPFTGKFRLCGLFCRLCSARAVEKAKALL
nr:MAG TPA: hypothetical protein [Caudoviricetes sp.]